MLLRAPLSRRCSRQLFTSALRLYTCRLFYFPNFRRCRMSATLRPLARTVLLTTGGVLLGVALSLTNVPRAIAAQFTDVIVRNTAANPVPVAVQGAATVTGGVQITNTSPIPAT